MTTTTMHFGPEWMRPKHALRPQNPPSPPPNPPLPSGAASYSALLTPSPHNNQESPDPANPFLYSKEDLLKFYKDGGGRGGLGLEVERWEGVVREVGSEPVALKEWSEGERKLFAGSINSEVRRRQSSDYLSPLATQPGERPKLSHSGSGMPSPLRERFGGLTRKRDGPDQPALTAPRKHSLSSTQGSLGALREAGLPSARTRGSLTPGFDGILNSGETWTSRRRASESGTKLNSSTPLRGDGDGELQPASRLKIDEEEEESSCHSGPSPDPTEQDGSSQSLGHPPRDSPPGAEPSIDNDVTTTSASVNGSESPTIHNSTQSVSADVPVQSSASPATVTTAPQPVTNPAGVEWSYLDPQGQVQGPFQAELMQKWYEEGYFALDLLMRRLNLDEDWTPVGDLAQRAGSEKIFLFNFDAPAAPPGLSRLRDPPQDPLRQQQGTNGYSAPYQPVPTRSIDPSALDAYFTSSSPVSNSPSSSFGAGRFGNNSPVPTAFGLVGAPITSTDSPIGPRPGSFVEPAFIGARRTGYTDTQFEPGFGGIRGGLGNPGSVRASSVDSYGLNSTMSCQPPWGTSNPVHSASLRIRTNSYDHIGPTPFASHPGSGLDPAYPGEPPLTRGLPAQQDVLGQTFVNLNQRDLSRLGSRDMYQLEHRTGLGLGGFDGTPSASPFDSPAQHQPFGQSPAVNFSSPAPQQASSSVMASSATIPSSIPTLPLSQPAWADATESMPKRTGLSPFDNSAFPTSRNTTATRTAPPPPPTQPWVPIKQPSPSDSSQSPWFSASQAIIDDGWGHIPGPHSLTVSNLTQHTQQQATGEGFSGDNIVALDSPVEPAPLQEAIQPSIQTFASPSESSQQPTRSGRKFSVQTSPAQPTSSVPLSPSVAQPMKEPTPSTSSVSVPTKPVWSTEDDKRKSSSGASMSLREIQEMETKKQETRKAAERERVRASATVAASPSEDSQLFTASWGLPTSQVGAKTPAKDAAGAIVSSASASTSAAVTSSPPTPASSAPPTAVWTNTQKPAAKKSMRDILEEEERRKKAGSKESMAAAAARRAYAETTNKANATSAGGAWTTIGANGKATAAAVAASPAGRQAITSSSSVGSVVPSPSRGSTATSSARSPAPPAKTTPVAPKADDAPIAPSPDFMKWLNDSLKQLNSSVNYEEIASMLLSFPLDGDATTVEIISELIYDNSTTLDGRRFAQDFIARRRADAASRKPSSRAPSIADVVKAQPKPSQQAEWGGFKVVKQKKKGGRS